MNNLKTIGLLCFFLAVAVLFQACKKDSDLSIKQTDLTVSLNNPESLEGAQIRNATISFKEINSGNVTSSEELVDNQVIVTLPEGSYDVSLEGEIEYTLDGETVTAQVRGYEDGIVLNGPSATVSLKLFLHIENAGFVIKEIFFSGNRTPENSFYHGDKYFIINNNSEEVQYADGLVIAESTFNTISKTEYTPNIMAEAFTTGTIVMILGDGDDYPIEPGASFVIANNAINHLEYNPNSLDLTNAEFELELTAKINVDNPQVPNLINVFKPLTMLDQGHKSYVLARLEGTTENFLAENKYTYEYLSNSGTEMSRDAYKLPNEWIIDAVNLSVKTTFEWIVTAPSLDMGWTYCSIVKSDANRYGKSVIRKVLSTTPDGREILKDTNNSTLDFEAEAKPSLMK